MTDEAIRQRILDNLSPDFKEKFYICEIEDLKHKLHEKNKYLIMYQILIMAQIILYIIKSFTK